MVIILQMKVIEIVYYYNINKKNKKLIKKKKKLLMINKQMKLYHKPKMNYF